MLKMSANPEATDLNDQPMDDKPRRNLATIPARCKDMYEYIKVDSKSGELEYMQICSVRNSEGAYKRDLMVHHPCIALVSSAAICA